MSYSGTGKISLFPPPPPHTFMNCLYPFSGESVWLLFNHDELQVNDAIPFVPSVRV